METEKLDAMDILLSEADAVGAEAMELMYLLDPALRGRYDARMARLAREDMAHHARNLAAVAFSGGREALIDYLSWLKVLFDGLHVPDKAIAESFRCVGRAGAARLPEPEAEAFRQVAERAAREYGRSDPVTNRYLREGLPDDGLARAYVQAVVTGRRDLAEAAVAAQERAGKDPRGLYLSLFQPAQREIGRLWHLRAISVAQEHFATAVTQHIMSALYPRIVAGAVPNGRTMIAACAQGELHELGLRMVADIFQAEGWDTRFLGANLPVDSLLEELRRETPELVALSASIPANVRWIAKAVEAIRSAFPKPPGILVGGIPFLVSPGLWRELGADGSAPDCEAAVREGLRLVGDPAPADPRDAGRGKDGIP